MKHIRTRLFGITLSFIMLISLLPVTALAGETAWNGTTVNTRWYDDNTSAAEFTISDSADLAGLAKLVNEGNNFSGKTIKLGADIDLGGKEWTPIGNSTNSFKGVFEGNKHTITNLYVNKPNSTHQGLFGYIKGTGYTNCLVTDLNLTNVNVTGFNYTGGLSGQAYTCGFKNVTVSGNVIGGRYVGGLVGHVYTQFEGCNFVGSVTGEYGLRDQIGGIAGSGDGRFYNCTAIQGADSEYLVSGDCWNGGIIGGGQEGASAIDCYVKGNIMNKSEWYGCSGAGIAGEAGMYANCKFTGNYFDGVVYCSDKVVNAPIIGLVNPKSESETVLTGMTVGGNSWNTEIYPPDLKVAVAAMENKSFEEITVSATRKEPRNANLVGSLADLEYMEAGNLTIVGTEVTSDALKDFANNSNGAFEITINGDGTITVEKVVAKIDDTTYPTLAAAIEEANRAAGGSNVTVTITKSGNYAPFTITRANVTVEAADDVEATITVSSTDSVKNTIKASDVTLRNLDFISENGASIIYYVGGQNPADSGNDLTLDGCTFTGDGTGTALFIHQPDITITGCTFQNFERGYYTCGDGHAAGAMTFINNEFTNVRVPIDGYWGKPVEDGNSIQIKNNTIDPGTWGTSYIQLWDYAQYQRWLNGAESKLNPEGKTALNATISGNTYKGDVVIYKTHCDWFSKSNVTIDDTGVKVVDRKLIVLDGLKKGDSVTVTNKDGSPITAFNESTGADPKGDKYVIYSLSEGEYKVNVTQKQENGDSVVTEYDLTVVPTAPDLTGGNTQKIKVTPLDEENNTVAVVNNVPYTSLAAAVEAAKKGDTVELQKDISIDTWNQVWNVKDMTIKGNNHTITIGAVESGVNGNYLFYGAENLNVSDLTIDFTTNGSGFSMVSGKLENVKMYGGSNSNYAVFVGTSDDPNAKVEVSNCLFDGFKGAAVYSQPAGAGKSTSDITVNGTTISGCGMTMCSYAQNTIFTNNTVTGGSEISFAAAAEDADRNNTYTITGNIFQNVGKIWFYGADLADVTFTKNQVLGNTTISTENANANTNLNVSENYWGGNAPGDKVGGSNITGSNVYYVRPAMQPSDLNTYVPPTTGGGSSSSGDYLITVDKTTGGKVTVNPGRADKGDEVTITVKPNDGYELDQLSVTDKDGDSVKVTNKGNGKYTFTMPGSQITIKATFKAAESSALDNFTDVNSNAWYADAVEFVIEEGLMTGTSDTTFAPDTSMSRAMIWTVLAAYNGANTSGGNPWYAPSQQWAMINGVSDGSAPNGSITREQLAVMLWRAAGSPSTSKNLTGYADANAVSDWAVEALAWAVDNGIISGMSGSSLAPQNTATRAQVAVMLMQFVECMDA